MLLSTLLTAFVFVIVCLGLAWPVVARLTLAPAEKLVATAALSLTGVFLFAWIVYVAALPGSLLWILPPLAVAGIALRPAGFRAMWRDRLARQIAAAQLIVTAWCLGWLATVVTYSGGGWAKDWYEHWERARFFLELWPLEAKFVAQYTLAARPPFANVVTAAYLQLTRADFAHYQIVSTLLASMAFLPAAVLAARFAAPADVACADRRGAAVAVFTVVLLLNPMFVVNATFAWTKLPSAFFVLAALVFFLRLLDADAPRGAALLSAACLAAGLLVHYSAAPYGVLFAVAWLMHGWRRRWERAWWRSTAAMAMAGALLLATWFGWSIVTYGGTGTFLTNTSVTDAEASPGGQLVRIALNLFDTVVPHFLRTFDTSVIAQASSWGRLRDWFFMIYQVNLLFAFGSVAWVAMAWELWRARTAASRYARHTWTVGVVGTILLGVGAVGARDHWGLAHVCLQALVILGLAFLASRWAGLTPALRGALCAGAVFDFVFGIALHFGVQSFALDSWLAPGRAAVDTFMSYNQSAIWNLREKFEHSLVFFSDAVALPFGWLLTVLVVAGLLVAWRARASLRAQRGSARR